MHFSRVVAVVASSWSTAAEAANEAAGGRGIFSRELDSESQEADVQREVCDGVLYLVLAVDPTRLNSIVSGAPGTAASSTGDDANAGFATECKHDLEALRRLLFVFSCAHVVIWVRPSPRALSLTTFGLLNTLKAARPRFTTVSSSATPGIPSGVATAGAGGGKGGKHGDDAVAGKFKNRGGNNNGGPRKSRPDQVRGWPGRSMPYLVFAFAAGLESPRTQAVVMGTLKACGLVGNPTRSSTPFCRAVKNDCCCAISSLRSCVNRLVKQVHVDAFSRNEWLQAASALASVIRVSATSGLVSTLDVGNRTNAADENSETTSNSKGSAPSRVNVPGSESASSLLSKKDVQSLARLESATRAEDALCRSLADRGMPFALETYVRGLPSRYGTAVHESHLELAVRELRRFTGGRGAVARRAEKRLTDQCKRIWRGQAVLSSTRRTISTSAEKGPDRRLCDAISLTGRPCVRLLRENLSRGASGRPGAFDIRACSSETTIRMACSCGRSMIERPDPFLPGLLNHTYPSHTCCAELAARTHDLAIGGSDGEKSATLKTEGVKRDDKGATETAKRPVRRGGSWMLHDLGPSIDFPPQDRLDFTGFVPRYDRLERWNETDVFIGLEYESLSSGNRRFYPVSGRQSVMSKDPNAAAAAAAAAAAMAAVGPGQGEADDLLQWPLQDVDLFIAPDNVAQDSFLQLQRIYVRVPPTALHRVLMHAHVHFQDFGNALFTHRPIELAPGRLYCLCLPHVYLDSHGHPIMQASAVRSDSTLVSVARLRPGLLKAVATAAPPKKD